MICSRPAIRFVVEPDRRDNGKHDEKRHGNEIREHKWRLALRRSHRFQGWHFKESLHDCDEDINIEGNYGADYENLTPGVNKVKSSVRVGSVGR